MLLQRHNVLHLMDDAIQRHHAAAMNRVLRELQDTARHRAERLIEKGVSTLAERNREIELLEAELCKSSTPCVFPTSARPMASPRYLFVETAVACAAHVSAGEVTDCGENKVVEVGLEPVAERHSLAGGAPGTAGPLLLTHGAIWMDGKAAEAGEFESAVVDHHKM